MRSQVLIVSLLLICCCIFSACQTYEFEGEACQPLPGDEKVEFYSVKENIPVAAAEIGTLRFTTPGGLTTTEVRQMLKKEALNRGANGVYIVKMNPVAAGQARTDQLRNQDAPAWNVQDNSHTSNVIMTDNIVYANSQDPDRTIYKYEVEARCFFIKGNIEQDTVDKK